MSLEEYRKALRLGRREYQQNLSRGTYPYLQVLEEITSNVEISSETYLGLVQVPISQIVGTNGRGRSTAFANNFMPLMDENTEFASKWSNLCDAHLEEGIRDPIKCYEFYNRFYVIEGNKRVSVLKYFGAVMVPAQVTRIVPRPTGTTESRIYQEFLKFYKITEINYLQMSKEGNFTRLLELLQKTGKDDWDGDTKRDFLSAFTRFGKAFEAAGGEKLDITWGDALVEYLKFYSYETLLKEPQDKVVKQLQSIWQDICKLEMESPIGLQIQPQEEAAHRGLLNLLGAGKKHLRVAFINDRDEETSSWTYGHEMGRAHLKEVMGDKIETTAVNYALSSEQTPEEIVEKTAEQGYDVIFTTTPRLKEASLKAAANHPEVKILNCSVNMAYRKIRTYYGRMYEAKFLAGLIAGVMTETDRIIYVADYPISGLIANINGFARGVQLVNPRARVHLLWSTSRETTLDEEIKKVDADIVSHQDMITPALASRQFGLYKLTENGDIRNLAMPFWNWGNFYERILRNILSGAWEADDEQDTSVNYWWGLSAGVIDLVVSEENVPEGVRQLVKVYRRAITNRSIGPFDGYIRDQAGRVRAQEDGYISTRDIVTMDWLADNVDGKIPTPQELSEQAQKLIHSDQV